MSSLRVAIGFGGLALILALANWDIAQKRSVSDSGEIVLLELRPVDPRSLFQGDYMALALAEHTMPDPKTIEGLSYRGTVILALDADRVGRFARLDDGSPLQPGELRVRYRRHEDWRGPRLDYGARSYFFQERDAERYAAAKYAVLRVAPDGDTILTELADQGRAAIKPQ